MDAKPQKKEKVAGIAMVWSSNYYDRAVMQSVVDSAVVLFVLVAAAADTDCYNDCNYNYNYYYCTRTWWWCCLGSLTVLSGSVAAVLPGFQAVRGVAKFFVGNKGVVCFSDSV